MKIITMKHGHIAYVDDGDYERIARHTWSKMNHGSAQARIGTKRVQMHRFIMNAEPGQMIDHINHNRLDNRKSNLRFVTAKENGANKRGWSGRFKGVYDMAKSRPTLAKKAGSKRFQVRCGSKYVGYFASEFEAAKAYDQEAIRMYGEYALLNFPKNFFSPITT